MSPKKYGREFSISIAKSVSPVQNSTQTAETFVKKNHIAVFTCGARHVAERETHAGKCSTSYPPFGNLFHEAVTLVSENLDDANLFPILLTPRKTGISTVGIIIRLHICGFFTRVSKAPARFFLTKMILFCSTEII